MLRRSIGVAQGFPWEVLSGSPEFDGLGALRLTTEVTKARLRQFQSLISSTYDSETSLAMGMLRMAQRWGGLSHPVNMMDTSQLRLLQPVDSTAPQAVHLIAELRELGYKLVGGWVSSPYAESPSVTYRLLAATLRPRVTRAVAIWTWCHYSSGGAGTPSCG